MKIESSVVKGIETQNGRLADNFLTIVRSVRGFGQVTTRENAEQCLSRIDQKNLCVNQCVRRIALQCNLCDTIRASRGS